MNESKTYNQGFLDRAAGPGSAHWLRLPGGRLCDDAGGQPRGHVFLLHRVQLPLLLLRLTGGRGVRRLIRGYIELFQGRRC